MNDIVLVEDKTYTLAEVVDAVKQTLDAVSKESEQNTLRYSVEDVYWLLHDMLRYVNRNIPGEFALWQTKKGTYRVTYRTENTGQTRSRKEAKDRRAPNGRLFGRIDRPAASLGLML